MKKKIEALDADSEQLFIPDGSPFIASRRLTIEELEIVLDAEEDEPLLIIPNGEVRTKDGPTLRRLVMMHKKAPETYVCPQCKGNGFMTKEPKP